MTFNPNDIGIPNGNFFGLPFEYEQAKLVLLPVPWDVTASYRSGASKGPDAILDASLQVDLYDLEYYNAWKEGVFSKGINKTVKKQNKILRQEAEKAITFLQEGGDPDDLKHLVSIREINEACNQLNQWVYTECWQILEDKKIPGIVGGDHSSPYGLLRALAERYDHFGILQIDAHADLREAYEGFTFSHASIMFNAINFKSVSTLVQVGVRDLCEDEFNLAFREKHIHTFDDTLIHHKLFNGNDWNLQCQEMISLLPQKVYISFDIDGLDPSLCPNTGTPVPGGLTFQQACYLLKTLKEKGKTIIGFDLCEVSPGEIDAITGARMLFKLCNLSLSCIK